MKVNRELLLKALETVKPGIAKRDRNIDQSTSFCFMGDKVVTYNDEISFSCPIENLELEGAVNAEELYSFTNKVSSEEIELEITENELLLKAGRSKAGLSLEAEITLPITEIGEIKEWKKIPKNFTKAISFAMASCSRNMQKPVLTCVHINGNLIEGADNHRLTNYILDKKVPLPAFLLPANICGNIVKLNPVEIAGGESWVHFKTKEGVVLSCRVFEEKYVSTSKHMVIEGDEVVFPKEIIGILERAEVFSKREQELDETIYVTLSEKKVLLRSESAQGWFEEKARGSYSGEPIKLLITPYLLKDIMKETNVGKLKNNKLMFEGENWKYITLLKE